MNTGDVPRRRQRPSIVLHFDLEAGALHEQHRLARTGAVHLPETGGRLEGRETDGRTHTSDPEAVKHSLPLWSTGAPPQPSSVASSSPKIAALANSADGAFGLRGRRRDERRAGPERQRPIGGDWRPEFERPVEARASRAERMTAIPNERTRTRVASRSEC
jgi:hypothetical protein